jgi:hypothetical protein
MDDTTALPSYITTVLGVLGSFIGGYLLKTGLVTADQLPALGGAALTIGMVAWRLYAKRHAREALKAAIAAPAGEAR